MGDWWRGTLTGVRTTRSRRTQKRQYISYVLPYHFTILRWGLPYLPEEVDG
jgi:hypothetical protein